jgi:hypothetical protein
MLFVMRAIIFCAHTTRLAAAACACMSIAVVTSCSKSSISPSHIHHASRPASVKHILLMRTPQTPSDAVPPAVTKQLLDNEVHQHFKMADIGAARRVSPNEPFWLIPASNGELCLVGLIFPIASGSSDRALPPATSAQCATTTATLDGRLIYTQALVATVGQPPITRIVGIVPDGVQYVKIILAHSRPVIAAVIRNAYEVIALDPVAVQAGTMRVPIVTFTAH